MLQITVPESSPPIPLRDFIRYQAGMSLTTWRKVKRDGTVLVNDLPVAMNTMVKAGDFIVITGLNKCTIQPADIPISIAFEDEHLLVVNKPAGMLIHPTTYTDQETLANAVMFYYQQQDKSHGFHPIHRLDRKTSGLVAIAKNPHIQHRLSLNGAKHLQRWYLALITGHIKPVTGIIDAPIARHPQSIIERIVHPDGQPAITCYEVLDYFAESTLIELELKTGRTHQIRVHLSHIGHPLLGDDLYGGSTQLLARQALHAHRLSFLHPITNEPVFVSAPLPTDMQQLLSKLSPIGPKAE